MGHTHSHTNHYLLIPITIHQLQANQGRKTSLSLDAIRELDYYIGNTDGKLGAGKNFSHTCSNIFVQNSGADIKLQCIARKKNTLEVPAETLLGQFYEMNNTG